jgi:hypothetical protein
MRRLFSAALASLAVAIASPASAAFTVETSPFITTPSASTGFESAPVDGAEFGTPFLSGGVSVTYTDPFFLPGPCCIKDSVYALNGTRGWNAGEFATGYTSIKLASGGTFTQVQFLTGSAALFQNGGPLGYTVLNGNTVVASGTTGPIVELGQGPYKTFGFSGDTFTEVRLWNQADSGAPLDYLVLDDIVIGGAAAVVPEPSTWAMMLGGFGLAGAAARRSSRRSRIAWI